MDSNGMTYTEWIRWLGDAISTETDKPFDEIDYDFVEECGCLLDELLGKSEAMTSEEMAERLAKLNPMNVAEKTQIPERKPIRRRINHWKVAIIAAIAVCMGITVLAVPQLRTLLVTALQWDIGDSVDENGLVYSFMGNTKQYKNMDELIATENLDILSFEDPTGKLKVKTINYIVDSNNTLIDFNDETILIRILHDTNGIYDTTKANSEKLLKNNLEIYSFRKERKNIITYYAYIYYNDDTYMIQCQSEETLLAVINSLKEGK